MSSKTITRNTTYSNLFICTDLDFVCYKCKEEVDILNHSYKKVNIK